MDERFLPVDTESVEDEHVEEVAQEDVSDVEPVEEEEYIVTPEDDVSIVLPGDTGEDVRLSPRDVQELYRKVAQYEKQFEYLRQLQQYEPLLNYVANDELSNRVILYRMQGNSPREIVEYLYQYYKDMPEETQQPQSSSVSPDVEQLKQEVAGLREYLSTQSVIQENANLLLEQAQQSGVQLDDNGNYPQVLAEISRDIFNDPLYIVRNKLNQRQARVVLQELQARVSGGSSKPKAAIHRGTEKRLPKQFPTGAKVSGGESGYESKPKDWSLQTATQMYNKLFGN